MAKSSGSALLLHWLVRCYSNDPRCPEMGASHSRCPDGLEYFVPRRTSLYYWRDHIRCTYSSMQCHACKIANRSRPAYQNVGGQVHLTFLATPINSFICLRYLVQLCTSRGSSSPLIMRTTRLLAVCAICLEVASFKPSTVLLRQWGKGLNIERDLCTSRFQNQSFKVKIKDI